MDVVKQKRLQTEQKTILLVEDQPDDVFLTLRAMRIANYKNVIVKPHGKDALDYLRSLSASDNKEAAIYPEIIIVDINMPVMNGVEMIRELRADSELAQIPIIVLSSSFNAKDQETCLELGARAYITKPTEPSVLLKVIEKEEFTVVIESF